MEKRKSSKKLIAEEKIFIKNPSETIYLLELDENGMINIENDQFLRIPQYSKLIFKIFNGCEISKKSFLITNYNTDLEKIENISPLKKDDDFSHLTIIRPNEINTSIYFSIELSLSGAYFFQICYQDDLESPNYTSDIWVVVDPYYKINHQSLDLNVNFFFFINLVDKHANDIEQIAGKVRKLGRILQRSKFFKYI